MSLAPCNRFQMPLGRQSSPPFLASRSSDDAEDEFAIVASRERQLEAFRHDLRGHAQDEGVVPGVHLPAAMLSARPCRRRRPSRLEPLGRANAGEEFAERVPSRIAQLAQALSVLRRPVLERGREGRSLCTRRSRGPTWACWKRACGWGVVQGRPSTPAPDDGGEGRGLLFSPITGRNFAIV